MKLFQTFKCTKELDGTSYMEFARNINCWEGAHIGMVVASVVLMVAYVLGVPLMSFLLMRRARKEHRLHSAQFLRRYCFLYTRYTGDFYNWNLVLLLRRFSFCMLVVFGGEHQSVQVFLGCLVCVLSMVAQFHFEPFLQSRYNLFDNACTFVILMYLLSVLLFMNDILQPWLTNLLQVFVCVNTAIVLGLAGGIFVIELHEHVLWT